MELDFLNWFYTNGFNIDGCFTENAVAAFQLKLLKQELRKAEDSQGHVENEFEFKRNVAKPEIPSQLHQ